MDGSVGDKSDDTNNYHSHPEHRMHNMEGYIIPMMHITKTVFFAL